MAENGFSKRPIKRSMILLLLNAACCLLLLLLLLLLLPLLLLLLLLLPLLLLLLLLRLSPFTVVLSLRTAKMADPFPAPPMCLGAAVSFTTRKAIFVLNSNTETCPN